MQLTNNNLNSLFFQPARARFLKEISPVLIRLTRACALLAAFAGGCAPNAWGEEARADAAKLAEQGALESPTLQLADGPDTGAAPDAALPDIVITDESGRAALRQRIRELDDSRDQNLLPKFGASLYNMDREAIDTLPQGENTAIDKVLLQAPGVSYDSAVSNPDFHVRNEYANVQYRINGIQLPDGVSGLGPVLETGFIGNLNLLDGALPAQYGLRTAGVVDISTKSQFHPGASVDLFGGSRGTVSPSFDFGGSQNATQYFLTGRYLQSEEGLENAMPTLDAIHDRAAQEKLFGYGSTIFDGSKRLTYIGGASVGRFQIPDVAGQTPLGYYGSNVLSSTSLNENEYDRFLFGIVALQTKSANTDTQLSVFTRYASIDFLPDVYGDLVFNDVASHVQRRSLLDGIQFDASRRLSEAHDLRAGFAVSAEQTQVDNQSTVLPLSPSGTPLPSPLLVNDRRSKLGWNIGTYLQDEWTLRPGLTLNSGLRWDRLVQFVSADQISPRLALVYRHTEDSSIHVGFARYFTPPMQAQATPTNLALFQGTTQQPVIALDNPVRPERANYFDVGTDQKILPGLSLGADIYYKRSTDQIDDGQFGQAVVLTQFNYARGFSRGTEFKLNYQREGLRAYANVSVNITRATDVVTNQYLFDDPVEFAYLASHYIYTDDAQETSASAGAAYHWQTVFANIDAMYGSGLRTGFANLEHVPGYVQVNAALGRDFEPWRGEKPLTVRLSVVNLLDRTYLLRSGTGIGEFAPQYGPRRGFFLELKQVF